MNEEDKKHEHDNSDESHEEPSTDKQHLESMHDEKPLSPYVPVTDKVASHMYGKVQTVESKQEVAETKNEQPTLSDNAPGVIILQWLTYAFWGWTLLAVNSLVFIVMLSLLNQTDAGDSVPYAIAASLVLLPISLICDIFYGKREPVKKTGAATVVMVIHAVIFALFGIGSLIAAVFLVVQMSISTSSNPESSTALIISFLICALLYGFTFLRTLNPTPSLKMTKIYPLSMFVVVAGFIIAAFAGPVVTATLTKDDRDVKTYLSYIARGVNSYVQNKKMLPESLSDVTFEGVAGDVVKRGLVTYKKEDISNASKSTSTSTQSIYTYTYYRYQLCVNYKKEDSSRSSSYSYSSSSSGDYSSYPSTSGHPAGDVCYKIQTSIRDQSTAL